MGCCGSSEDVVGADQTNSAPTPVKKAEKKKAPKLPEDPVMGAWLLDKVPLLGQFPKKKRNQIGGSLETKTFSDGEFIFRKGDIGDGFYMIKAGGAKVLAEDGKTIADLKPGDYFGEGAILKDEKGGTRGADIQAVGASEMYFLDKVVFKRVIDVKDKRMFPKRVAISAEDPGLENPYEQENYITNDQLGDETRQRFFEKLSKDSILFSELDEKLRAQLIDKLQGQDFPAGHVIIRQGNPLSLRFYLIESGTCEVFKADNDPPKGSQDYGPKVAEMGVDRPLFGDLALMYNAPRAATVITKTPCRVWFLDRYTFRRVATNVGESRLEQYIKFLSAVDILSSMLEHERVKIAEALEEVSYNAGQVIFKEGDQGDALYIVAQGCVKIFKGEGKKLLQEYKTGQVFGERSLSLKNREPRAGTAVCETQTYLLKLDKNSFDLLLGPLDDLFKDMNRGYERKGQEEPDFLNADIKFDDLVELGVLGKGSFGTVKLVNHTDAGGVVTRYALKAVNKQQIVDTRQQSHIMSEKRVMAQLNSRFLIKLYATFKSADQLFFLLEPSLGGELFTVLRSHRLFPEPTARFYAASVICAFEYMHERNIVYRDLKPENLLLTEAGALKVTDFGFAKKITKKTWTLCGTPEYLAPEIVAGKGHGKGVDWWTVGVLIFEMLASYTPFYHEDHMLMYARIARGRPKYPPHFTPEAKKLIKNLLIVSPSKRLGVIMGGADKIKAHPWFEKAKFDWRALEAGEMKEPIKVKVDPNNLLKNFDPYDDGDEEIPKYKDDGSGWCDSF